MSDGLGGLRESRWQTKPTGPEANLSTSLDSARAGQ